MSKILELRSKRNALWEQTKAFLEKNRGENGLVAPEAVEQYNKMAQEVKDLGAEIERLEQQAQLDAQRRHLLEAVEAGADIIMLDNMSIEQMREAIAWNGTSSAAVTATPMISNRIPVSTMQIRTTNDRISPAPSSKLDDTKLMSAEIRTVTRKISAIHLKSGRADLPVFFFFAAAKAASKIMLTI